MACLIRKRGRFYRKIRLDLWGYFGMYYNVANSEDKRVTRTLAFLGRIKGIIWKFYKYMRGKYVFRLWNRPRSLKLPRLKANYIRPRHLRSFYMILKNKTYVKYIEMSMKGKFDRGFISTFIGYLESRLFIVIYRLNIVTNIFLIKSIINLGFFAINFITKKHINTKLQLGDILTIKKKWRRVVLRDMAIRASKNVISRNIKNYYANYLQLFFIFFRVYKVKEIHYPIRIDIYRAIDFIGPLR